MDRFFGYGSRPSFSATLTHTRLMDERKIGHSFDVEAWKKEFHERKNPDHKVWDGAKFDMFIACDCILMKKDGSALIYQNGGKQENFIILPRVAIDAIVKMALKNE